MYLDGVSHGVLVSAKITMEFKERVDQARGPVPLVVRLRALLERAKSPIPKM